MSIKGRKLVNLKQVMQINLRLSVLEIYNIHL